MSRTGLEIAASLRANVDAWYADEITRPEMGERNRRDWAEANAAGLAVLADVERELRRHHAAPIVAIVFEGSEKP